VGLRPTGRLDLETLAALECCRVRGDESLAPEEDCARRENRRSGENGSTLKNPNHASVPSPGVTGDGESATLRFCAVETTIAVRQNGTDKNLCFDAQDESIESSDIQMVAFRNFLCGFELKILADLLSCKSSLMAL